MARPGFHTLTLGCKLNRFDSAAIEGELTRRGYASEPDPARAAVVVINTCTVTHRADSDGRKLVRALRRINPHCKLLVTGCYAERDAEALRSIGGVDAVFGNRDKPRVGEILGQLGIGPAAAPVAGDRGCDGLLDVPEALQFGDRARAFLRVQEGCRLACSYCVIPQVRGPSRSVPPERVLDGLRALLAAGYREVVLTGVNTGDWGRDLVPRADFAGLLGRLLAACGPNRIRLNSLEPLTLTDEVIGRLAGDPRLAPHVQVPLQSGSAEILRRMRRNYRPEDYLDRVRSLRRAVPHAGIGADVIVGFPGETERHFEETFRLVGAAPLDYLHVFAWSPRPGTPAAALGGRVDPAMVRDRSTRLRALGESRRLEFARRMVGRVLDAVVLGPDDAGGATRALTGNFLEVALAEGAARRGELIGARVERVTPAGAFATRVAAPGWAEI